MACFSDCISTVVQGMTMFRLEGHNGLGSVSEIFEGSILLLEEPAWRYFMVNLKNKQGYILK